MDFPVRLTLTGRNVDITTPDGANAFLEQPAGTDGFNFFSTDLKTANAIRKRERKKGKLNNTDRQTLRQIYGKVYNVALVGSPELFREKVPMTELEAWLNHAVEILRQITNDCKWINTGSLLQHDSFLMTSLVGLSKHPTAAALMFGEIEVLQTISKMMSTLGKPPSVEYADNVVGIFEYTYSCRQQFDKKWNAEKMFKKLESTGIFEHYLRCAAIDGSILATQVSPTLNELLTCTAYLQKRFKEDTPCGDTVRAIVKGTNGHAACTRVLSYMNTLIRLSRVAPAFSDPAGGNIACRVCKKLGSEEDIKLCSKCFRYAYCSKECQRVDWKAHKRICSPVSRTTHKNASASQHIVNSFSYKCYVDIMIRLVEECDKGGGLNFDEMVLEVDLCPDPNGSIPLMKDPPEFQVIPITKYFDGTRFSKPGSVFAEPGFLAELQFQRSHRKPTELLCVISHDCSCSYQFYSRVEKGSQKHFFCQEALEAFRSLVTEKNFSMLWEICSSEASREHILKQLGMDQEVPSDFIFP